MMSGFFLTSPSPCRREAEKIFGMSRWTKAAQRAAPGLSKVSLRQISLRSIFLCRCRSQTLSTLFRRCSGKPNHRRPGFRGLKKEFRARFPNPNWLIRKERWATSKTFNWDPLLPHGVWNSSLGQSEAHAHSLILLESIENRESAGFRRGGHLLKVSSQS